MKKRFRILRQARASAGQSHEPYFEEFDYEARTQGETVATALCDISRRSEAASDRPLAWEHSCLQKKCGACAMVIDQRPSLACDVRLSDIDGDVVTVEPLKKFPVIEDLRVDRSAMPQRLKDLGFYPENDKVAGDTNSGSYREIAYESARCLQCGLCLEVCPNYARDNGFGGMAAMTSAARFFAALKKGKGEEKSYSEKKRLAGAYRTSVYEGCGKSLACRDICPAGLDLELLLSRTNATAVWNH